MPEAVSCSEATVQGFKPVLMISNDEKSAIVNCAENNMVEILQSIKLSLEEIKQEDHEWSELTTNVYSRTLADPEDVYILGTKTINCTMHEMAQLMTVNTSSGFRMLMTLLHDRNFIDGTIVLNDLVSKREGIDQGIMSVKWFAYRGGGYLSKAKAFCMLEARSLSSALVLRYLS